MTTSLTAANHLWFGPLSSLVNIHETVRESHPCMGGQHHHHSLGLSEEHMGTNLTSAMFCSQMGQVSNILSSLRLSLDD